MTVLKKFEGHIILNYRSGKARIVTRYNKRKVLAYEIPIHYNINVNMTDPTIEQLNATIDLPDVKVTELVLDQIAGDDNDKTK